MVRQPPGISTAGRNDIYIQIAIVVTGVSQKRPVGGKDRISQPPTPSHQPSSFATLSFYSPDFTAVNERNLRLAECWRLQQQRLAPLTGCNSATAEIAVSGSQITAWSHSGGP